MGGIVYSIFDLSYVRSLMWDQHTEPLAFFTDQYVARFCHLQHKLIQVVSCHHGQCKSSSLSISKMFVRITVYYILVVCSE